MRKIYIAFVALATAAMTISGCKKQDPYFTASEDDYPRILNSDIRDVADGKPISLGKINRDQAFDLDLIVTPSQYTTVTWYCDGEFLYEGKHITHTFIAGDYALKAVARTTKGLETYRNFTLTVKALAGDPSLDKDEHARWLNPGKTAEIAGTNIEAITGLKIDGVAVEDFTNVDGVITFTIPQMENGDYKLVLVSPELNYGDGTVKVTDEEWVDPSVKETTLWEGSHAVDWGSPFSDLKEKAAEYIADGTFAVGKTLRVYVSGEGQGCIATAWWTNVITGGSGDEGRGDTPISGDMYLEAPLSAEALERISTQDGLLVVGNGFEVTKVSIIEVVPTETVLWSGSFEVSWGSPFSDLKEKAAEYIADGTFAAGKTLRAYVSGEGQGCIATAWWTNVVTGGSGDEGRGDTPISGDVVLEAPLTDEGIERISTQDGLLIVGNGFTLTKVTIE